MPTKSKRRAQPGTEGGGDYFRIIVRPKQQFTTFRYHDVGGPGHIQRLTGRRKSGSWATQAWLISKSDAHLVGDRIVADTMDARDLLKELGSIPKRVKEDLFEAKDRVDVGEKRKPTEAQIRARRENMKKARAARWAE